jgi:hypothetical protein
MYIDTSGRVSFGTTPEAGFPLKVTGTVKIVTGPGAGDNGLNIEESTHITSSRASLTFGTGAAYWHMGQDFAQTGVKDFFLYDGNTSQTRVRIDTGGRVGLSVDPESGWVLKTNGHVKVVSDATQFPQGLAITASAHATSERAEIGLGTAGAGWQIGQDANANGTKDFYIYDGAAGLRFVIGTAGTVGIGNNIDASYKLYVQGRGKFETGSGVNSTITLVESSGSSARSSINFGSWDVGQDVNANNTLDWYLYGVNGLSATADTAGNFYFKQGWDTATTLQCRRNATNVAQTIVNNHFMKLGRLMFGFAYINLTETASSTGNEFDVTFTGIGTPAANMVCGHGTYWDATQGLYGLTVYVQNTGRFYFTRTDAITGVFQTLGQSPNMATSLNGDWIQFFYAFVVTADFV